MFSRIYFGQSRTVGSSAAYIFVNIKFHDFPGPGQKFHDFPGLESKLSNSMTFQVFQDRYEPCNVKAAKKISLPIEKTKPAALQISGNLLDKSDSRTGGVKNNYKYISMKNTAFGQSFMTKNSKS